MAVPVIGAGGVAGIATEATYGTYEASTHWLAIGMSSLNGGPKLERPKRLLPAAAAVAHVTQSRLVKVAEEYGGDLEWVPTYDQKGTSVMLRHLFQNEPAETGAGPYTHTYTLGTSVPGLSVQQLDGAHDTETDLVRRFDGCVVTSWEFTVAAGGYASIRATLIAQGATDPQALSGTIAVSAGEEIVGGHGAVGGVTWDSLSLFVTDLTFAVDFGMVRTPYVGSYTTAKPARGGFAQVKITGKVYRTDNGLIQAYKAGDSGDLVLTLTGTSPNALTCTGENAVLTKCELAVDSEGVQFYACEWACSGSVTKTGLKFALVNGNNDWE